MWIKIGNKFQKAIVYKTRPDNDQFIDGLTRRLQNCDLNNFRNILESTADNLQTSG